MSLESFKRERLIFYIREHVSIVELAFKEKVTNSGYRVKKLGLPQENDFLQFTIRLE